MYSGNDENVYIFPWILLGIVIFMIIIMAIVVCCLLHRRRGRKSESRQNVSDVAIEIPRKASDDPQCPGQMANLNSRSMSSVCGDAEGHGEQVEGQQNANETTSPAAP